MRVTQVISVPIAQVDRLIDHVSRRLGNSVVAEYTELTNNGGQAQRAVFVLNLRSNPKSDNDENRMLAKYRTEPKAGKDFRLQEHPAAANAADRAAEVAKELGLKKGQIKRPAEKVKDKLDAGINNGPVNH